MQTQGAVEQVGPTEERRWRSIFKDITLNIINQGKLKLVKGCPIVEIRKIGIYNLKK